MRAMEGREGEMWGLIVMPTDEFAKHLGQFSNFAADLRLYLSF